MLTKAQWPRAAVTTPKGSPATVTSAVETWPRRGADATLVEQADGPPVGGSTFGRAGGLDEPLAHAARPRLNAVSAAAAAAAVRR